MNISVVVPVYDEVESLPELTAWISRVMDENDFLYEIILIDDGSKDGSWDLIVQLRQSNTFIKGIKFRRNYGKSAALNKGFEISTMVESPESTQDNKVFNPDFAVEMFKTN